MLKLLGFNPTIGTQWLYTLFVLSCIWNYLYNLELSASFHAVVLIFPYWALISLGCYALLSIGVSLASVKDCPEDAVELNAQIEQAKHELSAKGLKFT